MLNCFRLAFIIAVGTKALKKAVEVILLQLV